MGRSTGVPLLRCLSSHFDRGDHDTDCSWSFALVKQVCDILCQQSVRAGSPVQPARQNVSEPACDSAVVFSAKDFSNQLCPVSSGINSAVGSGEGTRYAGVPSIFRFSYEPP